MPRAESRNDGSVVRARSRSDAASTAKGTNGSGAQQRDGRAGVAAEEPVELELGRALFLALLEDLVPQPGFFGAGPQHVGVGGRAGPVLRLQVLEEGVEPADRALEGLGGAAGEGGGPVGLLDPGREEQPDPVELGRGHVLPGAADLGPQGALAGILEDLFDAEMDLGLVALLLEAGDGHALDAGLDLGLGAGPQLERPAPGGVDPGHGRQDLGVPGQGDLDGLIDGEAAFLGRKGRDHDDDRRGNGEYERSFDRHGNPPCQGVGGKPGRA